MGDQFAETYLVYGASWCPFCSRACELLNEKKKKSYFFDAADDPEFLQRIKDFYGSRTVPVVCRIDSSTGKCHIIGGCSDLELFLREDERKQATRGEHV